MRLLLLGATLLAVAPSSGFAQRDRSSDSASVVIAEGEGDTYALAVRAALTDAVARVAGVAIVSRTEIAGDVVVRDDLASASSGHVRDYTIIRQDSVGRRVRVFISARVSALDSRTRNPATSASTTFSGEKALSIAALDRDQRQHEAVLVHRMFASHVVRPSVYDVRVAVDPLIDDGNRVRVPLTIERVSSARYAEEIGTLRMVLGALAGADGITRLQRSADGRWTSVAREVQCRACNVDHRLVDVTRALVLDDSFPLRDPVPSATPMRGNAQVLFPALRDVGGYVVAIVDAEERELTAYRIRTTAAFAYLTVYTKLVFDAARLSLALRSDTGEIAHVIGAGEIYARGKRSQVRGGAFAPSDLRSPYAWLTITDHVPGGVVDTLHAVAELTLTSARSIARIDVTPALVRIDLPGPVCRVGQSRCGLLREMNALLDATRSVAP